MKKIFFSACLLALFSVTLQAHYRADNSIVPKDAYVYEQNGSNSGDPYIIGYIPYVTADAIWSLGPTGCYASFMITNDSQKKGIWVSMFSTEDQNNDLQIVLREKPDNMDLIIEATLNTGSTIRCNGDKYGERVLAGLTSKGVPHAKNFRLVPHDSVSLPPYNYRFNASEESYLAVGIPFYSYFIGLTDAAVTYTDLDVGKGTESGPSELVDIFLPIGKDLQTNLPIGRHVMPLKMDAAFIEATTKPQGYRFTAYITELQEFMLDAYILKFKNDSISERQAKRNFRRYQAEGYCVIVSFKTAPTPVDGVVNTEPKKKQPQRTTSWSTPQPATQIPKTQPSAPKTETFDPPPPPRRETVAPAPTTAPSTTPSFDSPPE
ncbi:MAG: hypothetical protein MUD00_02510 [Candidatus Pacebacteria bacterium]|nr:hypothetical protein [Candidatus Paceibacterota bacterium]